MSVRFRTLQHAVFGGLRNLAGGTWECLVRRGAREPRGSSRMTAIPPASSWRDGDGDGDGRPIRAQGRSHKTPCIYSRLSPSTSFSSLFNVPQPMGCEDGPWRCNFSRADAPWRALTMGADGDSYAASKSRWFGIFTSISFLSNGRDG
jgi:hypothetical protein